MSIVLRFTTGWYQVISLKPASFGKDYCVPFDEDFCRKGLKAPRLQAALPGDSQRSYVGTSWRRVNLRRLMAMLVGGKFFLGGGGGLECHSVCSFFCSY